MAAPKRDAKREDAGGRNLVGQRAPMSANIDVVVKTLTRLAAPDAGINFSEIGSIAVRA